jgi:hypothetical protein
LKTLYIYGLDERKHAELGSLFLEDAPVEIDGVHYDLDSFVAALSESYSDHSAVHRISGPLIELLGGGEARGRWTFASVVVGSVLTVREAGYYHDTYRKLDGAGWRIASSIVTHPMVFRETDARVTYPSEIMVVK